MTRLAEWLRRRPAEAWITFGVVLGASLFVYAQLKPGLLFRDTTPAGGDMGAHVWGPAFLREHLLPNLRLSGWAPDWYAGFPAYQFYMVLPSLLIVFLDVVLFLPYNVAFKLVAVSGLVAMPVCAYAMGRLARLPFPSPLALSLAAVGFVFERAFSIYGGNAASTLAGEFAFTISLCFALLFLGVVLRGLDTGRNRAWAAGLLALTVLNHLIPAVFAVVGATVALLLGLDYRSLWADRRVRAVAPLVGAALLVVGGLVLGWWPLLVLGLVATVAAVAAVVAGRRDEQAHHVESGELLRLWWLASAGLVGGLLTAWWTLPFVGRRAYVNDMDWEKLHNYAQLLLPGRIGRAVTDLAGGTPDPAATGDLTWVLMLGLVGAITAVMFRRRFGTWVVVTGLVMAVGVVVVPQGRLWNVRLLPFWYLCLYLLAALAVVEAIAAVATLLTRRPDEAYSRGVMLAGPLAATLLVLVVVGLPLRALPFGQVSEDQSTYSWLGISTKDRSYIPLWAEWNFSGYEDEKKAYPEYQEIVSAMDTLGEQRGCGRAMWEYESQLDRFGTPMALMLLPYWTDGCIGSMEGLYFEASATVPYHFINQSELSAAPSRPQRNLPYGGLDLDLGVDHLQLLGVRYYMAFSPTAIAQAEVETDLTLVASVQSWRIYEVAHAELVQPLSLEPVVVSVPDTNDAWQDMALEWYLDRSSWGVLRAASGPSPWQRIRPDEKPAEKRYTATTVSEIATTTDSIAFQVDRPGAPVLVKASYFPNWKVKGAEGPYRVAPNLMVVVPTDNFVELSYGRTKLDWFAIAASLAGLWLVIQLGRRRLRLPPRTARTAPLVPRPSDDELATVGAPGRGDERWVAPPEDDLSS